MDILIDLGLPLCNGCVSKLTKAAPQGGSNDPFIATFQVYMVCVFDVRKVDFHWSIPLTVFRVCSFYQYTEQ